MLNDVTTNTLKVFEQFIPTNSPINSKRNLYDSYRLLQKVIDDIYTLSEHYLALDFSEHFLQNSSFGEPVDKWRFFFNKDLERLNKSIKKYYLSLAYLSLDDDTKKDYLTSKYNFKSYFGYIRDEYNCGFVEPCSCMMICNTLSLKIKSEDRYLGNFEKIDLSTYEQRLALQADLRNQHMILKNELSNIKQYINNNYVLDDLL